MNEVISTLGPTCPYCGHILKADEELYYDEHRYTEQSCPACDKRFSIQVRLQANWTSKTIIDGFEG